MNSRERVIKFLKNLLPRHKDFDDPRIKKTIEIAKKRLPECNQAIEEAHIDLKKLEDLYANPRYHYLQVLAGTRIKLVEEQIEKFESAKTHWTGILTQYGVKV